MTPELISRVDTVLASWCPDSPLAHLWWQLAATWLLQHGEDRHATEASMRGVLLALVREAWGYENLYVRPADARGGWIAADIVRGRVCPQTFSSEDDALVAALEAAPEVPG